MTTPWIPIVATAGGLMAAAGCARATDAGSLLARVDHLVYATPDLNAGIENLDRLLGIRATPGGQHPGRGTRNALISLGSSSYIEIIGVDPDQPKPDLPRTFGIDDLAQPRLVTWAANAPDLTRLASAAAAQGVVLGEVVAGSRRRPDGVLLTWHFTNPLVVVGNGIVPFFIDWGTSPHPARTAAQGATLAGLRAEHPDPDRVQHALRQLGLDLPVTKGQTPALIATIVSPRGRVELR